MARNHHIQSMKRNPDGSLPDPQIIPFTATEDADADAVEAAEIIARPIRIADEALVGNKALRALALTLLDEINILRTKAGLQPRTVTQLKIAVRNHAN